MTYRNVTPGVCPVVWTTDRALQLLRYLSLISLMTLPMTALPQGGSSEPFRGQRNPFAEVLGLDRNKVSLSRDSTRIPLNDGGYVVLILRSKKLHRIHRFDRNGTPMECGDLMDGQGSVRLRFGKILREAEFVDGLLNGVAREALVRKDSAYTRSLWSFSAGELDGESLLFSHWDLRYVAQVLVYEKGALIRRDLYGKWSTWHALIPFYPHMTDPTFLCSRMEYEKGKVVKHECFVKKCRRCGG